MIVQFQEASTNIISLQVNYQPIIIDEVVKKKNNQQSEEIICRICLQQMKFNEIFFFCRCKGFNSHVHQRCLLFWVAKLKKQKRSYFEYYCFCDVCKGKIQLQSALNFRILSCQQAKIQSLDQFCQKHLCSTTVALVILILCTTVLGLIIYLDGFDKLDQQKNKGIKNQGYTVTLAVLISFIMFDVTFYVLYFFLKIQMVHYGIKHKQKSDEIEVKQSKRLKKQRRKKLSKEDNNKISPSIESIGPDFFQSKRIQNQDSYSIMLIENQEGGSSNAQAVTKNQQNEFKFLQQQPHYEQYIG